MPDDGAEAGPADQASTVQLHQRRAPLADAASVFASENPPIVLLPTYAQRLRNDFLVAAGIALAIGVVGGFGLGQWLIFAAGAVVCLVLLALAVMRAFLVRVPEGTVALLNRGGKFAGELSSGSHRLPPWVIVSYLVTQREIPYDTPLLEVPTQDNVRASIDTLLTFAIVDAHRFVFSISAPDFDRVLAAASQDAVRMIGRGIPADRIADLARQESAALGASLSATVEPYGVEIRRVVITLARPSDEFVRAREGERLAALQRFEQAERQTLELQRQADQDAPRPTAAHRAAGARAPAAGEPTRSGGDAPASSRQRRGGRDRAAGKARRRPGRLPAGGELGGAGCPPGSIAGAGRQHARRGSDRADGRHCRRARPSRSLADHRPTAISSLKEITHGSCRVPGRRIPR